MTLLEFAEWLETRKPSAAQLEISPDYNAAVLATLKWVVEQAREKAGDTP